MATRTRKVLERDIENKFVKEVKKLGCRTRKLNGYGFNAWPDRLVLVPGGVSLFIEFKRPGETLSPTQEALHEDVLTIGHKFYCFDSWENALQCVREHIKSCDEFPTGIK